MKNWSQIVTEAELEGYFQALQNEFFAADTQFNIYVALRKASPDYDPAFRLSPQFWNFTIDAHINMVALRLSKLYDSDEKTISLPNLLLILENNRQHFTEAAFRKRHKTDQHLERLSKFPRILDLVELQEDKRECSYSNLRVKHLLVWRSNVIAHANLAATMDKQKGLTNKFPLTGRDVESLIRDGFSTVNKYAKIYGTTVLCDSKSSSYPPEDFQIILDKLLEHARVN